MPLKLVVAVDGSEPSQNARTWAIAFARRTGAELLVCSVFDPMMACVAAAGGAMIDPQPMLEALEADAARFCADAAAAAATAGVTAASAVVEGSPAPAIAEFVRDRHADLVVMGTHARGGLARGVLGSVAVEVVRTSRVPVITVRASAVLPGTGPVLVAVDGSAASAAATAVAIRLAAALGAGLHCVHVLDQRSVTSADALDAAQRGAAAAGIVCSTETVRGDVVAALIACAAGCGAAVIATGTHGRAGLGRLLLGSVAEGVMRASGVPVLVVRPAAVAALV